MKVHSILYDPTLSSSKKNTVTQSVSVTNPGSHYGAGRRPLATPKLLLNSVQQACVQSLLWEWISSLPSVSSQDIDANKSDKEKKAEHTVQCVMQEAEPSLALEVAWKLHEEGDLGAGP